MYWRIVIMAFWWRRSLIVVFKGESFSLGEAQGLVASWRLLLVDFVVRRMREYLNSFKTVHFRQTSLRVLFTYCFQLSISFYSVNSISLGRASYYLLAFPRCVMLVYSWSSSAWQSSIHFLATFVCVCLCRGWHLEESTRLKIHRCNTNDGQVYLKLLYFSSSGYLPALLHFQPMICDLVRGWTASGCQNSWNMPTREATSLEEVEISGGLICARSTDRLPRNPSQHFLSSCILFRLF